MKRVAFFFFCMFILVGCTQQEIKEGQVYVVKDDNYSEEQLGDMLNVEGRIPFQKYINENLIDRHNSNKIILTISPNGKDLYLMERIETTDGEQVIKGDTGEKVKIIKEDVDTKEQKVVIKDIPFVSKVVWNTEGNMVAFGGGERLTIYDVENKSVIMEEKLAQDAITNFFWSPIDETKLYSEQPDLANGSIYYLASQKKVEAYETREETYYKGKLDSNYYYGTKWDLANGDIQTVILDRQGKVIKVLTPGKFRDAYQRSLVVVGEAGFGLSYIRDINSTEKVMTLTKEYIYDVKFTDDGKIAYIIKTEDVEANLFYLHIVENSGVQLKRIQVSGDSIAVSPDGKSGYISGPKWQQVDFVENKLVEDNLTEDEEVDELDELQDIYTTIRGAMTTLYDFKQKAEQSEDRLKKYFCNTSFPEQWAYSDMEKIFEERVNRSLGEEYVMKIDLKSYDMKATGEAVSVIIQVSIKNPYGRGIVMDHALELIKSQDNWYVTGFSTFPYSTELVEVENMVQETIAKMKMGKLFSGELENKEITIGQIQFWLSSSIPQLASSVESANSVKVFLRVDSQGKEELYKLVIEKINSGSWDPVKLTQEELSSL